MYTENFKKLAKSNTKFRNVVATGLHSQIVVMSLAVGTDIGEETHAENDQIFFIVKGRVEASVAGHMRVLEKNSLLLVPAGTVHNIINAGDEAVKLVTVYSPAHHPDGVVHATKEEAMLAESAMAAKKSINIRTP